MSIKTNEMVLHIDGFDEVSFEVIDSSISEGQPYTANEKGKIQVTVAADNDSKSAWLFTIEAGRHKTEEVAEQFSKWIGEDEYHCIGCKSYDAMPGSLNFAVIGNLHLKDGNHSYTLANLVIAQGSNGTHNNWWLGGKEMRKVADIDILHAIDTAVLVSVASSGKKADDTAELGLLSLPKIVAFCTAGTNEFSVMHT